MGGKKNKTAALAAFLLCVFTAAPLPAWADDPVIEQAETLMKENRAADAYALLLPREDAMAGDPRFDYVFGVAALDAGHPDKATLALERVLALQPNFAGARLDMGRAYFNLGDYPRARAEFNTVLGQNPPPAARQTIERYLAAIAEREKARDTLLTGFLELVGGYDSNVNNSTSQASVAVPALGNLVFTLDASNVEKHDTYTMLAGGAEVSHQFRPGLAAFAGTGGRYRTNQNEDRFDIASVDGRGGLAFGGQRWLGRLSLQGERFYLDRKRNRDSKGAATDVRYAVNDNWSGTAFLQHNQFRFTDPNLQINDFNQTLGGVAVTRTLGSPRRALIGSFYGGHENAINDRADGDKDMEGWRAAAQFDFADSLDFFIAVGGQRGRYKKVNLAFQTERRDKLYDGAVGFVWRLGQAWSLRPQCGYSKNDSNIPIYEYQRLDCSIGARYQF